MVDRNADRGPDEHGPFSTRDKLVAGVLALVLLLIIVAIFRMGIAYFRG